MNKKKAAILIAGLTRTYEKTKESFFSKVFFPNTNEYDIDIYLCFWDKTHTRGMLKNENITTLNDNDINEVISVYNPKKYHILKNYKEANSLFSEKGKEFTKIVGRPKNHAHPALLHQNGVMAQSYTWHSVFSLVEEEYDLFFRTRFDVSYHQPIYFNSFQGDGLNCFSFDHQDFSYVGDAAFLGDFNSMKTACSNYHLDMINMKIPPMRKNSNLFAEDILYDYLKYFNIKINLTPKIIKIIR